MAGGLTGKQLSFVLAYTGEARFNATEAARLAGYKGNDVTLAAMGYENLRKPQIQKAIRERMQSLVMSADEAMFRLSQSAAASIEDFIDITPSGGWLLNLDKAKKAGKLHLIKELKFNQFGPVMKLHDPQAAQMFIVKQERGEKLSLQLDEETTRLAGLMGVTVDTILDKLALMIRKKAEAEGLA